MTPGFSQVEPRIYYLVDGNYFEAHAKNRDLSSHLVLQVPLFNLFVHTAYLLRRQGSI